MSSWSSEQASPLDVVERGSMSRRAVLSALGSIMLAGCVAPARRAPAFAPAPIVVQPRAPSIAFDTPPPDPSIYHELTEERFAVSAVDTSRIDPIFWRRDDVSYETFEAPGTLVVDTAAKFLYHVTAPGRAARYGIGVGRQGFSWEGRAHMAYKREWPRWTPPDSMVARQPELEPYSIANGGMDPGARNPMGARALYIHKGNQDTLYRIHGTYQEWSIGKAVSSGCIRLLNHDIIHLYEAVASGSPIVVLRHDAGVAATTA